MIEDVFPFWMETLPILRMLNLRLNKFCGDLDKFTSRYPFPSLLDINTADNDHLSIKHFQRPVIIDFSGNKFVGSVPILGANNSFYFFSNNRFT